VAIFGCHGDDRVDQDRAVGPAAQAVDGVGRIGISGVVMRGDRRREVAAGREAEHSDATGIEAPFLCAGTDGANGALGVLKWAGVVVLGSEPILQHHTGDPDRVQPFGDFFTLVVHGQEPVAAARANDHRGTRSLVLGWQVHRDGRDIAWIILAAGICAKCTGRTLRPERKARGIGRMTDTGQAQAGQQKNGSSG